jgi:hypothetical protein
MTMRWPAVFALALGCAGCETFEPLTCDRSPENNPEIVYQDGVTQGTAYDSATAAGELLQFDGGARFALRHGLGAKPAWVEVWLSFDRFGTSADGGKVAQAAGNQAVITGIDGDAIHITNDSCVPYYLEVHAGLGAHP